MTEIDKTVKKIKKLLSKHKQYAEKLELQKATEKTFNLYLVGSFKNGNIYEQKHIITLTIE